GHPAGVADAEDVVAVAAPPPVPTGVEVLARGPVHEAYASLTAEAQPTRIFSKRPPRPLEEMPPEEKPEGEVVWISGYWAWDDDRSDFLWVSGVWRAVPPGKHWVAGYWRQDGANWQYVPGFWSAVPAQEGQTAMTTQEVPYLPGPPRSPEVADPGQPPAEDSFYVPGYWVWNNGVYAWRAGYWARVQPGYVWVPAQYVWSPAGYVY